MVTRSPDGPYYQAFPKAAFDKLYADDARRNHDEVSKGLRDATPCRRMPGRAWRHPRPLLLTVPPATGCTGPAIGRDPEAGLAPSGLTSARSLTSPG
jgi:hypothetical protein